MAIYVVCHACGQRIYLTSPPKTAVPYRFEVQCPYCVTESSYSRSEVVEERWNYTCVVCSGQFFSRVAPPCVLRCPHCDSRLHAAGTGDLILIERSPGPFPRPGSRQAAGALGGLLIGGAAGGPLGALVGLLAGSAIGASAEYREALVE